MKIGATKTMMETLSESDREVVEQFENRHTEHSYNRKMDTVNHEPVNFEEDVYRICDDTVIMLLHEDYDWVSGINVTENDVPVENYERESRSGVNLLRLEGGESSEWLSMEYVEQVMGLFNLSLDEFVENSYLRNERLFPVLVDVPNSEINVFIAPRVVDNDW